jgi:hypothetical protein
VPFAGSSKGQDSGLWFRQFRFESWAGSHLFCCIPRCIALALSRSKGETPMIEPFTISSDNADPLARHLVDLVHSSAMDMNPWLSRLMNGRGEYHLSDIARRRLERTRSYLREAIADIDRVLDGETEAES